MNTMCAAGTESFLDQQSHRLQLTIEQFSEVALKNKNPPRLWPNAARSSPRAT